MADIVTDGMTKVSFVPTITVTTAPTVAQLNGGQALEGFLTPDGFSIEFGNDEVDVTALSSTFGATLPGRRTLSSELTMKDQGRGAVPWSTFASNPNGYLVVRRNLLATTAWTAAQTVEVYPVQAGQRKPIAPAANEVATFAVSFFHTSAPVDGVVA